MGTKRLWMQAFGSVRRPIQTSRYGLLIVDKSRWSTESFGQLAEFGLLVNESKWGKPQLVRYLG